MLIGIVSDTHDHVIQIRRVVRFFKTKPIGALLHAGDFISPSSVEAFIKLRVPFYGVYGNEDWERREIEAIAAGKVVAPPRKFELGGRTILMVHDLKRQVKDSDLGRYDLIVHGNTHAAAINTYGRSLVVNPGEGCGTLSGQSTVALVNLVTMRAEIITLKSDS